MLSTILIENILNLVNRIGVVNKEQVMQMFEKEHNPETVEWCIKKLVNKSLINFDKNQNLLIRRQMVKADDFGQKLITRAAWILTAMGETKVRDYWTVEYPSQLLIIDEDNNVYDVTVITYQTLNAVSMSLLSKRSHLIPTGMDDNIIHIALLPDKDMFEKVKPLEFDSYCVLKDGFKPIYYDVE